MPRAGTPTAEFTLANKKCKPWLPFKLVSVYYLSQLKKTLPVNRRGEEPPLAGSQKGSAQMEGIAMQGVTSTDRQARPTGAQLPLAMVGEGSDATVLKVRGTRELRQHLAELGFVEGATVKVVSRVNGDVLVSVKGATFGIGRDMAMKIVTC